MANKFYACPKCGKEPKVEKIIRRNPNKWDFQICCECGYESKISERERHWSKSGIDIVRFSERNYQKIQINLQVG